MTKEQAEALMDAIVKDHPAAVRAMGILSPQMLQEVIPKHGWTTSPQTGRWAFGNWLIEWGTALGGEK